MDEKITPQVITRNVNVFRNEMTQLSTSRKFFERNRNDECEVFKYLLPVINQSLVKHSQFLDDFC